MILADKINKLRRESGWSQEELAEKLEVSRQSVSKWESGNSIPDLNKILKLSEIFGVSTDFLLKDDAEPSDSIPVDSGTTDSRRSIDLETANHYMDLVAETAPRIALGVALCILSPVLLIGLAGVAEAGFGFGEDVMTGIGVVVLLFMVAAAVMIFISNGMKLGKYEFISSEALFLEYGVEGVVNRRKEDFEDRYRKSITAGVVICILAVVPLVLCGSLGFPDIICIFATCLLLILIAIGVYIMVNAAEINSSYNKLLQEEDYTAEKKALDKKTAWFSGFYWCLATAIYLGISFYTMRWDRSWIIWPVAGVLYAALAHILEKISSK